MMIERMQNHKAMKRKPRLKQDMVFFYGTLWFKIWYDYGTILLWFKIWYDSFMVQDMVRFLTPELKLLVESFNQKIHLSATSPISPLQMCGKQVNSR
jgi:hypothetical protein